MSNKTKTLIILGFWLVLALFFVAVNEKIFMTGDEIRLKVRPVDPRDLLRGQYVVLNYDISNVDVKKDTDFKRNDKVYVILQKEREIHVFKEISAHIPTNGQYIKGQVDYIRWNYDKDKNFKTLNIKYGIENLFAKEKEAKEIEKRLTKGGVAVIKLDKQGRAKVLRVE